MISFIAAHTRLLIDGVVAFTGFFCGLAVMKAVIEPLATQWGGRAVNMVRELAYKVLDHETWDVVTEGGSGADLEARVRTRLEEETGQPWTDAQIEALFRDADPRAFADKVAANSAHDTVGRHLESGDLTFTDAEVASGQ